MPDFTLKVRGDTRDVQSGLNQAATSAEEFAQVLARGQAAAKAYAQSVTLTSKEASALGRALGLTAGEAQKLIKAEQLTAAEARKLAQAELQAAQQTRGLKDSAASAAGSLQTLATGMQAAFSAAIIQKVVEVGTELYNLGLEAANATNALTEFTGGRADRYVDEVTAATRGMVSEFQAAKISANLVGMGLADTSAQTAEMVRVATILGQTFKGMGAADAANEFSLLMANMSFLRLDQFGISSAAVRDRIRELKAETPGLSQETAFFNAVMEIGGRTADRVANSMSEESVAAAQTSAAMEDLKVALAEMVTEGLGPAALGARTLVVGLRDLLNATQDYRQEALRTADSFEDYVAQLDAVGMGNHALNQSIMQGTPLTWQQQQAVRALQREYEGLGEAAQKAAHLAAQNRIMAENAEDAAQETAHLAYQEQLAAEETEALAEATEEAEKALRAHTQAMQGQLREQQAMIGIAQQVYETIGTMGVQAYQQNAASGEAFLDALRASGNELRLTGDALNNYLLTQGMITPQQLAFAEGADAVMLSLSEGNITIERAIELWGLLEQGQGTAVEASLAAAEAQNNYREAMDLAAGRAVEATQTGIAPLTGELEEANTALQAIGVNAEPAMAALVAATPPALASMTPLADRFRHIVTDLTRMPGLAADSFAAVNEAAGMYVGGDTGIGMAAALIASMRNSWEWLKNNPNLNLSATVSQNGEIPSFAGGGSFVTHGPTMMIVGDNPGGMERVSVTPIGARGVSRPIPGGLAMAGGGEVLAGGGGGLSIGQLVIQTAATDARGIAREIIPALQAELRPLGLRFAEVV